LLILILWLFAEGFFIFVNYFLEKEGFDKIMQYCNDGNVLNNIKRRKIGS